jgi:hypothetical protein
VVARPIPETPLPVVLYVWPETPMAGPVVAGAYPRTPIPFVLAVSKKAA